MRFFVRFDKTVAGMGRAPALHYLFSIHYSLFTVHSSTFSGKTPGEGFPSFSPPSRRKIHPFLRFLDGFGVFRRLRTATKGAAFGIRKPFEKA